MTTYGAGTYGSGTYSPPYAGTATPDSITLALSPSTERFNGADGGVAGATVTTADTGSGHPWQLVQLGTGATITYTDEQVREGPLAYKITSSNAVTGLYTGLQWQNLTGPVGYFRFRWRTSTATTIGSILTLVLTNQSKSLGIATQSSTGLLRIINGATGASVATGSYAVTANTWYDIDFRVEPGVSATMRLHADDGTLLDTIEYTGSDILTPGSTINRAFFAYLRTSTATVHYYDAMAYSPTGWAGTPTVVASTDTTPTSLDLPVTLGEPTVERTDSTADVEDGITLPVTHGNPVVEATTPTAPDPLALTLDVGAPTLTFVKAWEHTATPQRVALPIALGDPEITFKPANSSADLPPADWLPITLGEPEVVQTSDTRRYVEPIVAPGTYVRRPIAAHIMGIGAADSAILWRGAPNHGIDKRSGRPSAPTIALPHAQSKSFTLRLNEPSEARADHEIPRDQAIVIEEMSTDLWWRRRDPLRNLVEPVGRFNADKVDISSTPTGGVRLSVSWVDYQGLLEERLVLKYRDEANSESQWVKGTFITDILRFAVPTNAGIDLTSIAQDTAHPLGVTTEPFELPPGTSIKELITNLQAISPKPWEWWVEMPTTDTARPALKFSVGGRGSDKGVVLFDIGSGQGPIESWTMQGAGDRYANSLFFSGAEGGVVVDYPDLIAIHGQRDATDQDSSIKATATVENLPVLKKFAFRRLAQLADRTPTWTVNLRSGFWEGRTHIDLGDWVTVHIALGGEVLSGKHRVTEITCDVDSSGAERVSLTLGFPRPARDPRSRNSAIARYVRKLKAYTRKGP
jgi:hypothetical protein